MKEKFNIPNLLSLYRLLSFPLIIYLIFSHQEQLFVIFIIINLLTDILDGFIARTFHLETDFGAKLDSYADIGMYVSAITGVIVFKSDDFAPHLLSLIIFITMFMVPLILSLIKFNKISSLHLYSSKLSTLLQGIFFLFLFTIGFNTLFYYSVIIWGIISYIEQTIIILMASETRTNVKGLYWFLKTKDQK